MSMPEKQEVMEIQGHPAGQRFLFEVPERFAVARWPRDADVSTICRCILGTLKYEPHAADVTVLRWALDAVIGGRSDDRLKSFA